MNLRQRIAIIYWKELLEILRDRRTLLAMIVVPIVLYPLLMVGSVQAVSVQVGNLDRETFRVGTVNEAQARLLQEWMLRDDAQERRAGGQNNAFVMLPGMPPNTEFRPLAETVQVFHFPTREQLEAAVRHRGVEMGVVFARDEIVTDPTEQNEITFIVDVQNLRGMYAQRRLQDMFTRAEDWIVTGRLKKEGLPLAFDEPFAISTVDVSSPPSLLGQLLPLILILMTITGAIYPAIDLTAGERERGTLESLMATPVPAFDLITGKFLVVTTVAIFGATLNLASVAASVHFGGFNPIVSGGSGVSLATMGVILLCLIPFAVLMSAIMIAVCSFARTFKEAQNYITPVILAVLIPGGIAAMPTTRLDGVMLVMPVGNMVLLSRDLLLGADIPAWHIMLVLLSTTLYALAAVAVAAGIFGRESVVFADALSIKAGLSRATMRPKALPPASASLMIVALLFPTWFFIQSAVSSGPEGNAAGVLFVTGWAMPLAFVVLPALVLAYARVNLRNAFALRVPSTWHLLAALLIGLSAWVPAHELTVLQMRFLALPQGIERFVASFQQALSGLPPQSALVLVALVPAVCEELLFRGVLMSGLSAGARRWTVIGVSAVIFGVFHFVIFKFAVTTALGIVLGYLCWQSRSVFPAMLAHALHNSMSILPALEPRWATWLGIVEPASPTPAAPDVAATTELTPHNSLATDPSPLGADVSHSADFALTHLPMHILAIGLVLFVLGLFLASIRRADKSAEFVPPSSP